ncbi:hypothetical protein ACSBR1_029468 [Camellia fascicularis]
MGKSTVSCFKIITCAGDPVDVEASESKASGNKRGWSFRKRSARHRVLSNTVISEMQSFDNSPETANVNLQTQPNTTFPEKTSAMPWTDEIPQLSTSVGSKVSDTRVAIEDNTMHDVKPDESKVSDTSVIVKDNTMHDVKPDESKVSDTSVIIEDNTMHDVKPDESKVSDASIVIEDNTMNDVKPDESKVSVTSVIIEDNTMHDDKPDESIIVVIQASIRAFLAQREILKLRNIVKLQAAVRGHLVRRHAVGTLRCVQAIVKMQAVVRARFAHLSSEGKLDGNHTKDNHSSKLLEKGNSVTKPNVTYASIEKLLSNKFAHQVLESMPRTKRIHIKCDPSKSDSAWQWLERWMSISSMGVEQLQKPNSVIEQEEKVGCSASQVETRFPSEGCASIDLKADITETVMSCKSEENLVACDAYNFEFQPCQPSSSSKSDDLEPPQPGNSGMLKSIENSLELHPNQTDQSDLISEMELKSISSNPEMESKQTSGMSKSKESSLELLSNQTNQSDLISQMELKSISSKPEMESEQTSHSVKIIAPEQVETEGKKLAFGTRKATNPAFSAVQSKFEELSLPANSARSTSSCNQDVGVESNSDAISSAMENAISTREIGLGEDSVLRTSRVKVGSECGTELSISSTLDSPDRSEIGAMEVEQEAMLAEEGTNYLNNCKNLEIEANDQATIPGSDLSYSISDQPEKLDDVNGADGEPVNSVTAVDSLQEKQKPETNVSNVQIELESETDHKAYNSETGHQAYKSSPEASAKSHVTIPESHGTPSSQVSVKAERTKSNSAASKRKSLSAGKMSPTNPDHDSYVRSSLEQLPKERKTGKRRSSFGSARPDNVDQEPRDSNSNNSLPNYMLATESARAKALANSSPRSSPDMQDKEIYVKKRHSLPSANEKHGSPRIHQSTSRAQQGAKGNGHPHEKKWQR